MSLEEITCGNLIAFDFERQYNVTFFYHISIYKIKYKSIKCNTFLSLIQFMTIGKKFIQSTNMQTKKYESYCGYLKLICVMQSL